MFRKVLIANRGEIALRILWACKELGIKTVAVHSEADADSLHVRYADEDVCIGPAANAQSYLNITSIISAAEITDADAIHPGYGYLAESAQLADICHACGIRFIGPSAKVIRLMGDKAVARRTMIANGVPVVPGSEGLLHEEDEAAALADRIGYPVVVKATSGGGGRGMRVAESPEVLSSMIVAAQEEARAAFGDPGVYLEKYLTRPRHIEFQVLGDEHGNLVHLWERECSIQRRHQKLIEEAPSPALTPELRKAMGEAALRAAGAVGYTNAGTIEFLLDDATGEFYFIEMNTRIQVEHPVTEMITDIDLVKQQIRIAAGEPLGFGQDDIPMRGHAIECRINAEHPVTFRPSPGKITSLHWPGGPGVRVDTAAYAEGVIPPYYDSMIAKLVTRGVTREEAISRMRRSLELSVVEGIDTSIPLQRDIVQDPEFIAGRLSTRFIEEFFERRAAKSETVSS